MITLHTRAVLFDMDGVLISSTLADERCWQAWASRHGMQGTFNPASTHGRRAVDTLQALRPDLDPAAEIRFLEDLDRQICTQEPGSISVLPGARELLATLPPARWTIVTSASARLMQNRLTAAGLAAPCTAVTADLVVHGKPHPEPYLLGAKHLGHPPQDCIVIEDAPSGVRSGKSAGCRVVGVTTSHTAAQLTEAGADWIVDSLAEVQIHIT